MPWAPVVAEPPATATPALVVAVTATPAIALPPLSVTRTAGWVARATPLVVLADGCVETLMTAAAPGWSDVGVGEPTTSGATAQFGATQKRSEYPDAIPVSVRPVNVARPTPSVVAVLLDTFTNEPGASARAVAPMTRLPDASFTSMTGACVNGTPLTAVAGGADTL